MGFVEIRHRRCRSSLTLKGATLDFPSRATESGSIWIFLTSAQWTAGEDVWWPETWNTPWPRASYWWSSALKRPVVCLFRFLMKPRYRNTSECVYQCLHDPTRTIEAFQLFLLPISWQNQSRKHCIHTLSLFVCIFVNLFLKIHPPPPKKSVDSLSGWQNLLLWVVNMWKTNSEKYPDFHVFEFYSQSFLNTHLRLVTPENLKWRRHRLMILESPNQSDDKRRLPSHINAPTSPRKDERLVSFPLRYPQLIFRRTALMSIPAAD